MNLPVVDRRGRKRRQIELADEVFGIEPNRAVMHQAYVAQRANAHTGTHSTKSRGEVRGSTAKIRRQKGMGAARKGSNRAATRIGGGIAFGPKPHGHGKSLPRQMRRLAIRSALSSHAASGGLIVVPAIADGETKTNEVAAALNALGVERRDGAPEERIAHPQPMSVADGATHDAPQHVAAALVRGDDAVGDEERARTDVIGDHAQRLVAGCFPVGPGRRARAPPDPGAGRAHEHHRPAGRYPRGRAPAGWYRSLRHYHRPVCNHRHSRGAASSGPHRGRAVH